MFIGRETELNSLENIYKSNKFEFVVIYGRRRVGKTMLISQFSKNKKSIYYTAIENSQKQNLENLNHCISEYVSSISPDISFSEFQTALEYIFKLSEKERLIFTIDEYPYLARSQKIIPSVLQFLIDKYKETSKLMLILCGSSISFMEDRVLAYKSPLYGRRTSQMKIQPFSFSDVCKYLSNYSDEDKAITYGIIGGTPQYLLQFDTNLSIEENVKNTFLNPSSFIFEEPESLLKQEARNPGMYNAIITEIATGTVRMSKIASKLTESTSNCDSHIKTLIDLDLLEKETPYGEKSSRRSIYKIKDNMYRFWYRFIPANQSLIMRGASDMVYKRIEQHLSEYMGGIFEDICKQYLWEMLLKGKSPIEFSDIGRWWGNNPREKTEEEIDIVGFQDKNTALFAECKWTNEKTDKHILSDLIRKSHVFGQTDNYYFLFSKSGFKNDRLEELGKTNNVFLVDLKEIISKA